MLFFFFDMQTLLSQPYSEIVSQAAIGGLYDDGNPISIWTITLPSGLAVHLFQFDWLGEPRSPKQPTQPLYSGHQARVGDWWAWSISVGSSCSGLNMLTPLKLARDPRRVWITLALLLVWVCPSSYLCVLVFLMCFHVSGLLCMFVGCDVWPWVGGWVDNPCTHTHARARTIRLGTAFLLIRTDRLFVRLFTSPSPFSRLLLSPLCQLDTWAHNHRDTHTSYLSRAHI